MSALEVRGLEETSARFDAYPAALQAALGAKATELAAALADLVKNDKLSGAVLNTRSGALSDSIAASVTADADGFLASVGSEGDVKYAAIQEYGGKTSAHEILPVEGRRARLRRRRWSAFRAPGRASRLADPRAIVFALGAR